MQELNHFYGYKPEYLVDKNKNSSDKIRAQKTITHKSGGQDGGNVMENKVGVIGVGNMGSGICSNLLKAGFKVFVYDIRPEPLEEMRKKGAVVTPNLPALAQECPLVFSVLIDYDQNLSILEGPEGLLENLAEGSCIFICSTISPTHVQALSKLAAERGTRLLDAPVSGGAEGASAGTLSLMIGGDQNAVEEHRKALEAISSNIYHMGDVGAGESAKAINQLLVGVHDVATAEAMLLAAKSGIDLKKMIHIIENSAGASWIFEHRAARMVERDFEPRGFLKILLKDTNIVADAAQSLDLVLPMISLARQLYQAGVNAGLGDEDDSAIVKVLEKLSNFSLA